MRYIKIDPAMVRSELEKYLRDEIGIEDATQREALITRYLADGAYDVDRAARNLARAAKRILAAGKETASMTPGRIAVRAVSEEAMVHLGGTAETDETAPDLPDLENREELDRRTLAEMELARTRGERLTYLAAAERVFRPLIR